MVRLCSSLPALDLVAILSIYSCYMAREATIIMVTAMDTVMDIVMDIVTKTVTTTHTHMIMVMWIKMFHKQTHLKLAEKLKFLTQEKNRVQTSTEAGM